MFWKICGLEQLVYQFWIVSIWCVGELESPQNTISIFFDFLFFFRLLILFPMVSDGMLFTIDWSCVGNDQFLILFSGKMNEATDGCGLVDNIHWNDCFFD